jgi:SAM-dependent methyltransferase
LIHSERFVQEIIKSEKLNNGSFVVELASNDGYLLQFFCDAGIPNLGIEPTASTANLAIAKGINVVQDFFTYQLSQQITDEHKQADLIIANNVYAHVPDIVDFTKGIYNLLAPEGLVSIEFPHIMRLVQNNQFDTIYHEHFSYLSLNAVKNIFDQCEMKIVKIKELNTHGGSLRVLGSRKSSKRKEASVVSDMLLIEKKAGMLNKEFYLKLKSSAKKVKFDLLSFLLDAKQKGEVTVAYGAAAKGNTLLNYCGIDNDLIKVIFDNSPEKHGKVLPGSGIPILPLPECQNFKIDNVLIMPWNIRDEMQETFNNIYKKNVNFLVAIPELRKF